MLAQRSFRPLPPSPAQSSPPSPRDLLPLSASRATPPRPLPSPATLTRSRSSASLTRCRPLPVPPGEVDALAPLRRLPIPFLEDASGARSPPRPTIDPFASPPKPGVRPLPTPVSPSSDSASSPPFAPTSWRQASAHGRQSTGASRALSLDDVECFGVRPKDGDALTPGHIAKAKSQDFQHDDRDRLQRRVSRKAALAIIARDKIEQEEAWRALVAKKGNQHGRL
ncbi:uncharacterized protein B0H18DRAFT_1211650 [Fomitopsis serialis]|uniref:uncharacterized protein n=1 Tax=Fomitopsis serialis TaxID=139415 RepID=UPI00200783E3|nr:uncharacterized protein B0H18DRAFT_1211650 [Neoantrodia serialis]KAH9924898.1 hypothetical protein B0H18DRAFT_1211650 [Neoantrodia serialis]